MFTSLNVYRPSLIYIYIFNIYSNLSNIFNRLPQTRQIESLHSSKEEIFTSLITHHFQVMVEAYRRDASSKDQLISELKSTKKRLLAEVKDLKQELLAVQGEKQNAELEQTRLQKEVVRVQEQMSSMEAHLQAIQSERDQLEGQIQVIIRN